MGDEGGLRERKKRATRSALVEAALRLAVERGPDGVTAEEIAEAAGVSARTFFNYFATKEQAFVADDVERAHRYLEAVKAGPPDADLWPLLRRGALATWGVSTASDREQALKEQLVRTSPAVLTHVLASFAVLEQELVAELARRTGDGTGLRPRLLANGVIAAARAAIETWLASDGATDPVTLLEQAFDALAPAFPDTPRTP